MSRWTLLQGGRIWGLEELNSLYLLEEEEGYKLNAIVRGPA